MTDKEKIVNYLKQIEDEYNVEIHYACESGSRAWGTNHDGSDYDVKFIYTNLNPDHYIQLHEKRDVIEREFEDKFEINGWDIKKTLLLGLKSNPSLIEWLNSNIVYRQNEWFIQELKGMMKDYSPISLMQHYCSLAHRQHKAYFPEGKCPNPKKWIYAVRPLLACQWMLGNGYKVPPLHIRDILLMGQYTQSKNIDAINVMLKRRQEFKELSEIEQSNLWDFYSPMYVAMKEAANAAPIKNIPYATAQYLFRKYGFEVNNIHNMAKK